MAPRRDVVSLVVLACVFLVDCVILWTWGRRWGFYDSDWLVYFHAAERLRDGRPVYAVAGDFLNPPTFLLLVRALLIFGYLPSRLIWSALSIVLLLASGACVAAAVGWKPTPATRVWGTLFMLLFVPTMLLIPTSCNSTAPVVFAYALALLLMVRGREGWAGVTLSLALLIKPQLVFLSLPLLLYKRRWRALGAYLLTGVGLTALSFILVGRETFAGFLAMQNTTAKGAGATDLWIRDIPGLHAAFLQFWPNSALASLSAYAVSLGLLGWLAYYWRGPWQPSSTGFAARWSATILVDLLVVPYAHSDDLVLLLIPAVVFCRYAMQPESAARAARQWIRPMLFAFYLGPVLVVYYRQHFMAPILLAGCWLLWKLAPPEGA